MRPIFITGIGTDVGKTVVAAILTEALQADYWKPVQAGLENGTDSDWVRGALSNSHSLVHEELYRLHPAASPHIASRQERIRISLPDIVSRARQIIKSRAVGGAGPPLIMEGAGGLLVPLNGNEFVVDLVEELNACVVLVSRNYLGSINHSLLTAEACRSRNIQVAGWIFNDQYMDYENEIAQWSGFPKIAAIPYRENPDRSFVSEQAERIREAVRCLVSLADAEGQTDLM